MLLDVGEEKKAASRLLKKQQRRIEKKLKKEDEKRIASAQSLMISDDDDTFEAETRDNIAQISNDVKELKDLYKALIDNAMTVNRNLEKA